MRTMTNSQTVTVGDFSGFRGYEIIKIVGVIGVLCARIKGYGSRFYFSSGMGRGDGLCDDRRLGTMSTSCCSSNNSVGAVDCDDSASATCPTCQQALGGPNERPVYRDYEQSKSRNE